MKKNQTYLQPGEDNFKGRNLEGLLEKVDYSMNSNLRIWHNTQPEGYPAHQHSALEVIIPIEAPYTVFINNIKFVLVPGSILFIPMLAIHEILPNDSGTRFIFMFNMEPFSHFQDFSSLEPVLMEPRLLTRNASPDIYEQVYSGLMQISDIYFSNVIFWEYSIYSVLFRVLTGIGREHYQSETSDFDEKSYDRYQKFTSLLSYLDSFYTEDLTLEQMASYVGFSKYHFARLFKEYTKSTFHDYLSRKRIQAAKRLLSSNQSITEIAFNTGFNNSTSFCRCFKKYTSYSPSEYRRLFIDDVPAHLLL